MTRTAIVTGASSGIGAATAVALQRAGYHVYAVARRAERLAALGGDQLHPPITGIATDVTDDDALIELVRRAMAETGRIDVLVNNAGYGAYGALEEVPLTEGRRQFDVNLFAVARLTQLALPHMRAQGSGRVVNVSSIGGKIYEPLGSWYHSTKFALEGMSDALRLELRPHGIQVAIVQPGAVHTEWGNGASGSLQRTSLAGPYAEQAAGVAAVLESTARDPRRGTNPDVVAAVIVRAATQRRARPRYVVGAGARPLLALRRALPDRAFDTLMSHLFRPRPLTDQPGAEAAATTTSPHA